MAWISPDTSGTQTHECLDLETKRSTSHFRKFSGRAKFHEAARHDRKISRWRTSHVAATFVTSKRRVASHRHDRTRHTTPGVEKSRSQWASVPSLRLSRRWSSQWNCLKVKRRREDRVAWRDERTHTWQLLGRRVKYGKNYYPVPSLSADELPISRSTFGIVRARSWLLADGNSKLSVDFFSSLFSFFLGGGGEF